MLSRPFGPSPKGHGSIAQAWLARPIQIGAIALLRSTEDSPPEGIPGRNISFRIDRMNCRSAKSSFAVLDDGFELWERHQFKRFHAVLFFSGSRGAAPPSAVGVRFFPMHPFSDEIGGTLGAGLVGGFEDDSVPKIQHRDLGFILGPESGEER